MMTISNTGCLYSYCCQQQEHTGNNNAYGCLEPCEPIRETTFAGEYIPRAMTPLER